MRPNTQITQQNSITFLVLVGPSPMNQELGWVILRLNCILVTRTDLKDSSALLCPQSAVVLDDCSDSSASFSLCLSIVQGNICNAQGGAGVIGTTLNVGMVFQTVMPRAVLVRKGQSLSSLCDSGDPAARGRALVLASEYSVAIPISYPQTREPRRIAEDVGLY